MFCYCCCCCWMSFTTSSFYLLVVAILLFVVVVMCSSTLFVDSLDLPRHVAEVVADRTLCESLYHKVPIVAVVVSSLANPADSETALLEAFAKAAMNFLDDVTEEGTSSSSSTTTIDNDNTNNNNNRRVQFVALSSDPAAAALNFNAPEISQLVRSWITRSSPLHHHRYARARNVAAAAAVSAATTANSNNRNKNDDELNAATAEGSAKESFSGLSGGVFIFRRKGGKKSDILWRDWFNETDDIDVPMDMLPVAVSEVLLAPTTDTTAERITRRVRCLTGPDVRELRTQDDLENFVAGACHPNGLSVVAWPRNALWPTAQKVPAAKLNLLRHAQQALAAVAQIERNHINFAWVDDDAPMLRNSTLLAIANGINAPLVAYVCDDKCRTREGQRRSVFDTRDIRLRFYPFQPFEVLKKVPAHQVVEVMQIAVSEFVAELVEVVESLPPTGSIESGISLADFPRSELDAQSIASAVEEQREREEEQQRSQGQHASGGRTASSSSSARGGRELLPTPYDTIVHMSACTDPVENGDAVQIIVIGDAISFDPVDSHAVPVSFFRPSNLDGGDVLVMGEKNKKNKRSTKRDLPPQFGILSGEFLVGKLCYKPATRAFITMRANRHYNVSDLPPNVLPHSTLTFYVEVVGCARAPSSSSSPSASGRKFRYGKIPLPTDDVDGDYGGGGSSFVINREREKQLQEQERLGTDDVPPEDPREILDPSNPRYNFNMSQDDIKAGKVPEVRRPVARKQTADDETQQQNNRQQQQPGPEDHTDL